MKHRYVKDISNGDSIEDVFLVAEKNLRANRNGNLYIQVELRDKSGIVSSRLWNASDALFNSFEVNDFVFVRGKAQVYQGAMQVILSDLELADPTAVETECYLPHTEQDINRLYARMRELLQTVDNPHLRALADCLLMDSGLVERFMRAPAGIKNHHAYIGGLLEHVVQLLEVIDRIAPLYVQIDRDLLLLGALLHDIGKVRELDYNRAFAYSDEGQLIGHLVIGVEMLDEKIRQAAELSGEAFPEELAWRLKHMIISHHGSYEFGSPKLPMTLEAVALNLLDNLDAKIAGFEAQVQSDRDQQSNWTAFNQATGRKLYKGSLSGPDSRLAD